MSFLMDGLQDDFDFGDFPMDMPNPMYGGVESPADDYSWMADALSGGSSFMDSLIDEPAMSPSALDSVILSALGPDAFDWDKAYDDFMAPETFEYID